MANVPSRRGIQRRRAAAAFAACVLLACTSFRRDRMSLEQALTDVIASHVKPGEPGVSVLVASRGALLLRRGFGLARLQPPEPMTAEHALEIGSITKQFTSVSILLLEQDGKLSLSDELSKWVPTFPTGGKRITLEQLLACTSGIPDFTLRDDWKQNLARKDSPAEFLARFAAPPAFEPGSEWFYSNTGYYLLGVILEKASGVSRERFMRERLFAPLGMTHTHLIGAAEPGERLAAGYEQDKSEVAPAPPVDASQVGAAGDLVSTVDDLRRWSDGLMAGRILPTAVLARARTVVRPPKPGPFDWTLGWARFVVDGHVCFGAKGGIDSGYTTFLADCADEGLVIAVLTNSTDPRGPPEKLSVELAHEVYRRAAK